MRAPRPTTFRDRQGVRPARYSGLSLPRRLRVLPRLLHILVIDFGESFRGLLLSGRAALLPSSRLLLHRTGSESLRRSLLIRRRVLMRRLEKILPGSAFVGYGFSVLQQC